MLRQYGNQQQFKQSANTQQQAATTRDLGWTTLDSFRREQPLAMATERGRHPVGSFCWWSNIAHFFDGGHEGLPQSRVRVRGLGVNDQLKQYWCDLLQLIWGFGAKSSGKEKGEVNFEIEWAIEGEFGDLALKSQIRVCGFGVKPLGLRRMGGNEGGTVVV